MKALCTDYSPLFETAPFTLSPFISLTCAKDYQYLLNASHKACACTGRRCSGLTGRGEDTGEALMRCPEPCPCTCTRAADVAALAVPGGDSRPPNFIGDWGRPGPDLLQWGVLGDGRGKSFFLLWIVIIALLTTPASSLSRKKPQSVCLFLCVRERWVGDGERSRAPTCVVCEVFMGSEIIYSCLEYLLFTPLRSALTASLLPERVLILIIFGPLKNEKPNVSLCPKDVRLSSLDNTSLHRYIAQSPTRRDFNFK